jgi:hypothetical protein
MGSCAGRSPCSLAGSAPGADRVSTRSGGSGSPRQARTNASRSGPACPSASASNRAVLARGTRTRLASRLRIERSLRPDRAANSSCDRWARCRCDRSSAPKESYSTGAATMGGSITHSPTVPGRNRSGHLGIAATSPRIVAFTALPAVAGCAHVDEFRRLHNGRSSGDRGAPRRSTGPQPAYGSSHPLCLAACSTLGPDRDGGSSESTPPGRISRRVFEVSSRIMSPHEVR